MPPRFFCDALPAANLSESATPAGSAERFCTLGPDETRHARKVLRLSAGQAIELFDGHGKLADAQIVEYVRGGGADDGTICQLHAVREVAPSRPRLTVASAVPKGPRAEAMVNQLGQLGVDVFVPVVSERGVVEPGAGKVGRYEKAALASAKQSGRPWLMRVEPSATLAQVCGRRFEVGLILDPRGTAQPDLAKRLAAAADVVVLIGPEGGWTPGELDVAEAAGLMRWRMAEHVLRIETAATAAAGIVRYLGPAAG